MRKIHLVLSGMFLGAFAFGGEFSYTIRNFGATVYGCHGTAANLAETFETATGIKPVKSRCLSEKADGYTIEITYVADKSLPVVSTSQATGGLSPLGRYASRQACDAAIAEEVDIFKAETRLTPAIVGCSRDGISSEKWAWYPRIDAFGDSLKRPQKAGYQFFSVPQGMDGKTLRDKIFASLKARDIRPVALIFRSQMAYGEAALHFYAADRLKLQMFELTRNASLAACQAQDAELDSLFTGDPNPPLVHYCGKPVMGAASELNALFIGDPTVEFRPSTERFKTVGECEAARPTLIQYYQQTLKLPVRGGFCGFDPFARDYRVTLVEDRT